MACWLVGSNGVRLRIDAGGVLIGRSPGCALMATDPRASNLQAIVRLEPSGPKLHNLGRNPVRLNGESVHGSARLAEGDRIEVPGVELAVMIEAPSARVTWWLEGAHGMYGVVRNPFRIGGGSEDHLGVEGWPASAVQLVEVDHALWAELDVAVLVDGRECAEGGVEQLGEGSTLAFGGVSFRIQAHATGFRGPTLEATSPDGALGATLEILPTGGRLRVNLATRQTSTPVSEQRMRLLAVLLEPPEGYRPGEFIPDEVVIPMVWPREAGRNNLDLNGLVYRMRKSFLKAGLPPHLLERAPTGGATRFHLAPGASTEVR